MTNRSSARTQAHLFIHFIYIFYTVYSGKCFNVSTVSHNRVQYHPIKNKMKNNVGRGIKMLHAAWSVQFPLHKLEIG